MRNAPVAVLVLSLAFGSGPAFAASSQGAVSLSGTARKEAKRPPSRSTRASNRER